MIRRTRLIIPLLVLASLAQAQREREFRSAPRFEPPAQSFAAPTSLEALKDQLARGKFTEAAAQIESLLRGNADEITASDERGLSSIGNWLDVMALRHGREITAAYSAQYDAAAKRALDLLRLEPAARAEDFYSLARRHRFSSIAASAYVEAGDRAVQIGDAPAAAAFYTLAEKYGWRPDEERATTLAVCRILGGESPGDLPASALKRGNEISSRQKYRGAIAFDAVWYLRGDGVGMAKSIPTAADGAIYLVGPRHIFAMKESGEMIWRWNAPEAWVRGLWADRGNEKGRGTIYCPAIFASPAGPQILVVRQPLGAGRDLGIRALRAVDGKLLWSTDAIAGADSLSFAGNPAVAGRFVYAVAVDFQDRTGSLVLVALDLLDGRVIFKCPLGTMLQMRRAREDPRGWDEFWEQTEPAVAGDMVYVTANVGMAAAVGRFDGKLRWTCAYEEKMVIIGRGRGREGGDGGDGGERQRLPVPGNVDELLRYRGTPQVCGEILVIAPQDTAAAFGLDLQTGSQLWKLDSAPATTLIGRAGNLAIFAGDSVEAIDATTGKNKWHNAPPPPFRITGPPAVVGDFVYIPITNSKTMVLSAETGKVVAGAPASPNLRQLLASEPAKKMLDDALILRSLGPPGVNPNPDIGKTQ